MAYNTGNPIGSDDARDFVDNSVFIDNISSSLSKTTIDRLGVQRSTLYGISSDVKEAASVMGWFLAQYRFMQPLTGSDTIASQTENKINVVPQRKLQVVQDCASGTGPSGVGRALYTDA